MRAIAKGRESGGDRVRKRKRGSERERTGERGRYGERES